APVIDRISEIAARYDGVTTRKFEFSGTTQSFVEIHLIGRMDQVPTEVFESIPGVQRVVRVSRRYRLIGRHGTDSAHGGFEYKRGMGITLEESLHACEYIASEGNTNIIFCLRGVKTHLGDPHRNLVDFAHVPVVRRLTRLPVCVDPSHSVGRADVAPDGIPDL